MKKVQESQIFKILVGEFDIDFVYQIIPAARLSHSFSSFFANFEALKMAISGSFKGHFRPFYSLPTPFYSVQNV